MDDRRELWITLAWRTAFACPFAAAATYVLATSAGCPDPAGRRLLGLALTVASGVIVGPGFAGLIAEPAGSLFYPRRTALPQPCRSIAESNRAHGRYAAAVSAYEDVVAEFPTDVESWAAMIEITLVHLQDRPRSRSFSASPLPRGMRER